MIEITKENLRKWITEMSKETEAFDCEYDFQFSLATKIKSQCQNIEIGFEKKIYNDKRCRCDLVLINPDENNERILIELKYIYAIKQAEKTSSEARKSFINDCKRIEAAIIKGIAKKGFAIFLTNKSAVIDNSKGEENNQDELVQIFHKNYPKKYWIDCLFKEASNETANNKTPKLLIVEVK